MERAVVERRLEVRQRIAGEDALGRRLADALLDAREEALRHGSADDPLGELDATARVRLDLQPDVAEHPVAAGLLLVLALDLGLAADRLPVGDLRLLVRIAAPNFRLSRSPITAMWASPIATQQLLAGRRPLDPRRRLLLEHPLEGRAHLVEVGLRLRLDRDRQGRLGEVERRQDERLLARRERVAGLGRGELGDRADLARLELADRLLVLAVQQEELADPLVLVAVRRSRRGPGRGACRSGSRR